MSTDASTSCPPVSSDALTSSRTVPSGTEGLTTTAEKVITAFIVTIPLLVLVFGIVWFWGEGVHLRDVLIAVVLYMVVGHGITVGFHRLLAHRSFRARRTAQVVAGRCWLDGVRRWPDRLGRRPPPSPRVLGSARRSTLTAPVRVRSSRLDSAGLWHAHIGWLLKPPSHSWTRHAADLLADRDLVVMNALFPFWCMVSLAIPFGLGWLLGGGVGGALTALLWAGGVRILVLHHVTWSINSLCHTFGDRPFKTTDRSTNLAGWRWSRWVSPGTTATTRSRVGPPRSAGWSVVDTSARLIYVVRAARMGERRALARPGGDRPSDRLALASTCWS